jgi:cobalt/nickel transport protein
MPSRVANLLLLLIAAAIVALPLIYLSGVEFAGADSQAEEVIAELAPGYTPWFAPIWEPPSGEVETLFFSLQAALGAGLIGYYLGYHRGRKASARQDR